MKVSFAVIFGITLVSGLFALSAGSEKKTGDIVFQAAKKGKVVFSHRFHAALENIPCEYCHTRINRLKEEAAAKKTAFSYMNFCIQCHNGFKAFRTESNCYRCHEMKNPTAHSNDKNPHKEKEHNGKN